MNSDQASRDMDSAMGLQNYVRLSLNDKNPMLYIAVKEKRVTNPILLQIKLEAVSRPDVLFFDCNATRRGANRSPSAEVVHFEVVKAKSQFAVAPELKQYYQAEVLVPSSVRP